MCLLTHEPNVQIDQFKKISFSWLLGKRRKDQQEKKHGERRKSENSNHNSQRLYLEMSPFCTIVKGMPSSPPSLHGTRGMLQPQGCYAVANLWAWWHQRKQFRPDNQSLIGQGPLLEFNPKSKHVQQKLQIIRDALEVHSSPLFTPLKGSLLKLHS